MNCASSNSISLATSRLRRLRTLDSRTVLLYRIINRYWSCFRFDRIHHVKYAGSASRNYNLAVKELDPASLKALLKYGDSHHRLLGW